jgi:hypothetical protein
MMDGGYIGKREAACCVTHRDVQSKTNDAAVLAISLQ